MPPKNPFGCFLEKYRRECPCGSSSQSQKQLAEQAGNIWASMSHEQKYPFIQLAAAVGTNNKRVTLYYLQLSCECLSLSHPLTIIPLNARVLSPFRSFTVPRRRMRMKSKAWIWQRICGVRGQRPDGSATMSQRRRRRIWAGHTG